jgi:hypothetical protein
MPRSIDGERQPLLERIDEGSIKGSNHWNLAGLSQKHFWVLVRPQITEVPKLIMSADLDLGDDTVISF